MKRTIFLAVLCAVFCMGHAQENRVSGPNPNEKKETLSFNKTEHDFGVIPEAGGEVECEFTVENTGATPLIILKATPSCGCTVAGWTEEPIAPGKKGFVKATFNPKGIKAPFTRSITVYTSGNPERVTLTLKGDVK